MAKFRTRNPPALRTPALHVWHTAPARAQGFFNMIPVSQIPNKICTILVKPGSTKLSFAGLSISQITNKCLSLLPVSTRMESGEKGWSHWVKKLISLARQGRQSQAPSQILTGHIRNPIYCYLFPTFSFCQIILTLASYHGSMDQLAETLGWSQKNKVYVLLFYFAASAL